MGRKDPADAMSIHILKRFSLLTAVLREKTVATIKNESELGKASKETCIPLFNKAGTLVKKVMYMMPQDRNLLTIPGT